MERTTSELHGADSIELYPTILNGDLLENDGPDFANADENALHVVTALVVDATAQLDGITVQGGNANGDDPHDRRAGGLRIRLGLGIHGDLSGSGRARLIFSQFFQQHDGPNLCARSGRA